MILTYRFEKKVKEQSIHLMNGVFTMDKQDGMNYAPKGLVNQVVEKGEFPFAAIGLDHGHIYGMNRG
jgi:hypothetical protein